MQYRCPISLALQTPHLTPLLCLWVHRIDSLNWICVGTIPKRVSSFFLFAGKCSRMQSGSTRCHIHTVEHSTFLVATICVTLTTGPNHTDAPRDRYTHLIEKFIQSHSLVRCFSRYVAESRRYLFSCTVNVNWYKYFRRESTKVDLE